MASRSTRRAFTLIEIIVCIAVVTLLLALAVPSLLRSRKHAGATTCEIHMHSAGLALLSYSHAFDDCFPFAGFDRHEVLVDGVKPHPIGGEAGTGNGRWSLLFPDDWKAGQWDTGLWCPKQPRYDASVPFPHPGSIQLPYYWISSATWLDPACLRDPGPLVLKVRPGRWSEVSFPSKKAVLFEQVAFCATITQDREIDWMNVVGQTFLFDSSVLCADGSVMRMKRIDGLPAAAGRSMPFDFTVDGVRGRDIP